MTRQVGGFRVSVDLQDFYSDERARSWVWVRDRDHAKRLRWLAAKLRRRWALQEPAALAVDGRLLHPRDPLALLQPDDTLRLIRFSPRYNLVLCRYRTIGKNTDPLYLPTSAIPVFTVFKDSTRDICVVCPTLLLDFLYRV